METVNKTRISRLRILIEERGGVNNFCKFIDRSRAQVYQWLNESIDSKSGKPRAISNNSARAIEEKCGKPRGWLDQPIGQESKIIPFKQNAQNDSELEPHIEGAVALKYINISGEIQGGGNGYLNMQQFPAGYASGCVAHPVSGNRCYALKVRGDSMSPRIRHGEIVIVDPDKAPESGEDVVVSLRDGRMMIKVFLYRKGNEITLGSINAGHGNITVTQDEIYDMHYVAARLPGGATCNMPE